MLVLLTLTKRAINAPLQKEARRRLKNTAVLGAALRSDAEIGLAFFRRRHLARPNIDVRPHHEPMGLHHCGSTELSACEQLSAEEARDYGRLWLRRVCCGCRTASWDRGPQACPFFFFC
jgi:hypothetical protein